MVPVESHIRVHEQGDRSLDGIFRLIEVAERQQPLSDVLNAMCADVAAVAGCDVASVYVRDRGGDQARDQDREQEAASQLFTMRGNVGFPATAVGTVRLREGEGIVGSVAARMRPVSVAVAERDEHFKYIPGLGEERFPALLAVPVLRGGSTAGVLVLQRRERRAFTAEEVVLATALATVINHALERTEERERQRSRQAERGVARLRGVRVASGAAMGRAVVLPTLSALARAAAVSPAPARGVPPGDAASEAADEALEKLAGDLRRAAAAHTGAAGREIANLVFVLDDRRFRNRLALACATPAPLKALSELAREYARVPFRGAGSGGDAETAELMAARAAEIEDLCVIVHAAISGSAGGSGSPRPLLNAGAVVVADRLGGFVALHALARGASAFVIDGDVTDDAVGASLARAAGVPLLGSVAGIFSWVQPEDLLVVDADAACVRVNPPATAVARFRNQKP